MNFTCGETSGHWHNGAVEGLSHVLIRRHALYEDLDKRRHAYHANGASQSQVSSVQVLGTCLGKPPPPGGRVSPHCRRSVSCRCRNCVCRRCRSYMSHCCRSRVSRRCWSRVKLRRRNRRGSSLPLFKWGDNNIFLLIFRIGPFTLNPVLKLPGTLYPIRLTAPSHPIRTHQSMVSAPTPADKHVPSLRPTEALLRPTGPSSDRQRRSSYR